MKPHRLLARQLQRTLGVRSPEQGTALFEQLAALAAREGGEVSRALGGLPALLEQVNQGYQQYDRDLALASRSLHISSDELLAANERVQADNELKRQTIGHLRAALARLATVAGVPPPADDDTGLVSLSQQLNELVAANHQAQRALLDSEAKFRALTTMSTDWFWEQDAELRFVATAGNSDRRAGLTPQAHIGKQRWELPHTEALSGDWSEHRACLKAHQPFRELMLRRLGDDGKLHFVEVSGAPLFDERGRFKGYHGVARDVTPRIEAEQAVRDAMLAADAASAAKSMFLANVSHELRTPLNGLLGMAELLLDDDDVSTQRERARLLLGSGRLLLAIINDLLDFAKIEAGRLTLDSAAFELRSSIDEVIAMHLPRADAKGLALSLHWDGPPTLWLLGDALRIQQVLGNLLSNAIKFTTDGEVSLHVGVASGTARSALRIEVRDSGEGIPAQAQARLFQPFSQADAATTRRHGGTGLGLAICKHIVELMQGRIGLRSEPDRGTTVEVELELPLAHVPVAEPAPAEDALPSWRGRSVLLVEDNPVNMMVATAHLERLGLNIAVASDGAAALEQLQRQRFDLVLMDCQMPVMDGYEAVARWRAIERLHGGQARPLAIVAMTASNMAGDRERNLALGFDEHLGKPFSRADLVRVLEQWLGAPSAVGCTP